MIPQFLVGNGAAFDITAQEIFPDSPIRLWAISAKLVTVSRMGRHPSNPRKVTSGHTSGFPGLMETPKVAQKSANTARALVARNRGARAAKSLKTHGLNSENLCEQLGHQQRKKL